VLLPEEQEFLLSPIKPLSRDQLAAEAASPRANIAVMAAKGKRASEMTTTEKLKCMFGKAVVGLEKYDVQDLAAHDNVYDGHAHHENELHWGGVSDRELEIIVVSGNHMPKMDMMGKIDPYMMLHYAGQKTQTSVQSNTFTPSWGEIFTFRVALNHNSSDDDSEVVSALQHLTLRLFDHDILGKDDKVGDGFVSGQRLAQIAKLSSGCSVEERVLIFKRPPKGNLVLYHPANFSRGQGPRMIPVIGHDNEHTFVTLKIRVRPARLYPIESFHEYHLDGASGASAHGAGLLRMALVLQPTAPGGMPSSRNHVHSVPWDKDGNLNKDADQARTAVGVTLKATGENS
jgi:hypothetical protein